MLKKAIQRLVRREAYDPSLLGVILNPHFLIRWDLWRQIRCQSGFVSGRVLDFGCGAKPYEQLFNLAVEYIGVDIQDSGHNHEDSKVDYFWDGKRLPFEDNYFDSVVSFEVFEHVFSPSDVFREIRRVVKPGGTLLMSTPFIYGEHEQPFDFARYTSFGIKHLLELNGFKCIEAKKTGSFFSVVIQTIAAYLEKATPKIRFIGFALRALIQAPLFTVALIHNAMARPNQNETYYFNLVVRAEAS